MLHFFPILSLLDNNFITQPEAYTDLTFQLQVCKRGVLFGFHTITSIGVNLPILSLINRYDSKHNPNQPRNIQYLIHIILTKILNLKLNTLKEWCIRNLEMSYTCRPLMECK